MDAVGSPRRYWLSRVVDRVSHRRCDGCEFAVAEPAAEFFRNREGVSSAGEVVDEGLHAGYQRDLLCYPGKSMMLRGRSVPDADENPDASKKSLLAVSCGRNEFPVLRRVS